MPSLTCDRCLSGRHRCLERTCPCPCRPIALRARTAIEDGVATEPRQRAPRTPPPVVHGRAGNYSRGVCREACCREPAMEAQRRRRAQARARKMSGKVTIVATSSVNTGPNTGPTMTRSDET